MGIVALMDKNMDVRTLIASGCMVLMHLNFDDPVQSDELVAAGALRVLVTALLKHGADPSVCLYASGALMNLARGGDARKEAIVTAGALNPLVATLSKHVADPGVCKHACGTMYYLACGRSFLIGEAIVTAGALHPTIAVLIKHESAVDVCKAVIGFLYHLSRLGWFIENSSGHDSRLRVETISSTLVALGALEPLVAALVKHDADSDVCENSAGVIRYLAMGTIANMSSEMDF